MTIIALMESTKKAQRTGPLAGLRILEMAQIMSGPTCGLLLADMDSAGVPAGPVPTIGEALSHPQTLARGMVVTLDHLQAGTTRQNR